MRAVTVTAPTPADANAIRACRHDEPRMKLASCKHQRTAAILGHVRRRCITVLDHGIGHGLGSLGIQLELDEDDSIFDDRAKRSQEPWEGLKKIGAFLGVGKEAGAVGKVAGQGQEEEEERKTYYGGKVQ